MVPTRDAQTYERMGAGLRARREARGLSQSEVAAAVGVTQPTYSQWERGTAIASADAARLARYFGTSVEELLGEGGEA